MGEAYIENAPVGRIFGTTVTDSSSYVNLYALTKNKGISYHISDEGKLRPFDSINLFGSARPDEQGYIADFASEAENNNFLVSCYTSIEKDVKESKGSCKPSFDVHMLQDGIKSRLFYYSGRSSTEKLSSVNINLNDITDVTSSVSVVPASFSADYYMANGREFIASRFLRSGALLYVGATGGHADMGMGREFFADIMSGYDAGNALMDSRKASVANSGFGIASNLYLLGDPLIKPALIKELGLNVDFDKISDNIILSNFDEGCPDGTIESINGECVPASEVISYLIESAVKMNDVFYCKLIPEEDARNYCFDIYAMNYADNAACKSIENNDELAKICMYKVGRISKEV